MKVLGCIFAIVGVVLCGISMTVFGVAISRAMDARAVTTISFEIGDELLSEPIHVDTSKFCMVSLKATVKSGHAVREAGKENEYDLQYKFPFRYTIQDANGKSLISKDTFFAHDTGARTISNEHVTSNGGSVEIQSSYDKIEVAAPGEIRVAAELREDEEYEARLEGLQLIVYDNVSKHAKSITTGVVILLVGGFLAVAGMALFLVGVFRTPKASGISPPPLPPAA